MTMTQSIHRGEILHFPATTSNPEQNHEYLQDGILITENGLITALADAQTFLNSLSEQELSHVLPGMIHHKGLLIPGMIDSHVHYPQMEMIASYGTQLLDWLNEYTFPAEAKFCNSEYAAKQAKQFIEQLFAHGTTTASVFATVHPESVNAFFSAAEACQARMICGKVMMDRNCPDNLKDTAESGYAQTRQLIEQWHKQGRSLYAITPRFAPTSSPEQLKKAGQLAKQHPDTFIQTHLSENIQEIEWVKSLYPESPDYLGVYEKYDLVRERALFGHCIHLESREYQVLKREQAGIIFCPTSNLFIGSGLFPYFDVKDKNIPVAIASDVGAGTSLSLLTNQAEAYKILQLQKQNLNPLEALYLCTQGAADTMRLSDKIGNLNPGTEADFVELDFSALPMLSQRTKQAKSLTEKLFALMILGDDRVIRRTYVHGQCIYTRE
ncbi:Guanine deaminase [Vibrio aerogenes CECT 7868]|uniref:Guanine deaminase n=1 Tax=Vibrio aerogenes CECT 7868 TaxID=1216006 RepID=A0A1M5ZL26_9VIBR|nr:guanine deaminase [Vibrio aerogenes]SHI24861.1 Guanine deaminase [Vibrio aerogenes CECT 7868]